MDTCQMLREYSAVLMMFCVKSCDVEVIAVADLQSKDVQTRLLAVCWRQRCIAAAAAAAASWLVISRLSGLPGARCEKQSEWKTLSGERRLGVMCFQCPVIEPAVKVDGRRTASSSPPKSCIFFVRSWTLHTFDWPMVHCCTLYWKRMLLSPVWCID